MMTLRRAQISDASSIAVLSIEVWTGTYLKHGIAPFFANYVLKEFTAANTAALITDPTQFIMLSTNRDGIDGVMRLTRGSVGPVAGCAEWEISTLYVQSRHHGKGIGKRLLHTAFDHAKDQGASSVWLTTNAENIPAIRFYHA